MPPKRKRSSATKGPTQDPASIVSLADNAVKLPASKRQASRGKIDTNPDQNADIVDGKIALRASPDADEKGEALNISAINQGPPVTPARALNAAVKEEAESYSALSELDEMPLAKKNKKTPTKSSIAAKKGSDEIKAFKEEQAARKAAETKIKKEDADEDVRADPDGDEGVAEDVDTMKKEAARPPPANSDYLPLPWKGRLGYACLNTYLRFSNPPVFASRTCRIASILEHRHPLKDPTQPEHATKNRPDKSKPASIKRGQKYVEELGVANARDVVKMLRWNDKYGIKFMRLSSEMFPFASHEEYGYSLAPFASEVLAEIGKVAAKLGHRLSTHPGQFTQLGSPRSAVIENAVRDLDYHEEMLSLLKLPEQADRDAVMILHLGGTFGDKAATIDRFRENYQKLSEKVKNRIVLENDDVSWSVHDLLPLCEELNIPLCLDFHHHNIIFDDTKLREGTRDIMDLYPRIKATWDRKRIKQKMHYSEPCPEAITGRQRRKHNPRPATLPPCPNDMDLMIEAKDKEQAVFALMRTFKLPGWETFNDIIPYERDDDNKPAPKKAKKKKTKKQIAAEIEEFGKELSDEEEVIKEIIAEDEVGMGGKEDRVFWPVGMEEWLRPKKREIKKKEQGADENLEEMMRNPTPANFEARKKAQAAAKSNLLLPEDVKKRLKTVSSTADIQALLDEMKNLTGNEKSSDIKIENSKKTPAKKVPAPKKRTARSVPTPSVSTPDEEEDVDESMLDLSDDEADEKPLRPKIPPSRASGRAKGKRVSYADMDEDELR
ncbi:putative UV-endonuclease UVE-1 [Coleophoma cylindrospora]|uniref:Putative UV-endonuclease UVE-1 n=1 Tax=Coleophoma cylindrospora TaxID=1849047 RepID=A0A3D8QXB4_9HELO|nr:putative UV-endonuclease UVE-1 [Coleophoma cylindrospora]